MRIIIHHHHSFIDLPKDIGIMRSRVINNKTKKLNVIFRITYEMLITMGVWYVWATLLYL
jgi:hypothetical protein